MASSKKVQLLVNPVSGGRKTSEIIAAVSRYFKQPEWRLLVHVLTGPQEVFVMARNAAKKRTDLVLVAGGDGTLNECARALVGTRTALGLIPAGTGNGFARAVGIPLTPDRAAHALRFGNIRKIDIGELDGGRVLINIGGVGFDAWAAAKANDYRWIGRASGFLRYAAAGIMSLTEFSAIKLRVTVDGESIEGRFMMAVVANTEQYGFGTIIAPGAQPHDGQLDVILVPVILNPYHFLVNFSRVFRGLPLLRSIRRNGKHIVITKLEAGSSPLHLDGEPNGETPVTIRVRKGALKILIP